MWGTRLGVLEMVRGGVTTFADMYYFEDVVARVTKEAGMRGILGETILDFPAPDNKNVAAALTYTETFIRRWKNDPLITPAVAPHSIYTLSEENLRAAAALARREGVPIPFESELSRKKYGLSPIGYLEKIGVLGPDVIGAHCIWRTPRTSPSWFATAWEACTILRATLSSRPTAPRATTIKICSRK